VKFFLVVIMGVTSPSLVSFPGRLGTVDESVKREEGEKKKGPIFSTPKKGVLPLCPKGRTDSIKRSVDLDSL